jgi:hypothetical protein
VTEQLDLFRNQSLEPEPVADPDPEPQPSTPVRKTQISSLPGETFEDIFRGAA